MIFPYFGCFADAADIGTPKSYHGLYGVQIFATPSDFKGVKENKEVFQRGIPKRNFAKKKSIAVCTPPGE